MKKILALIVLSIAMVACYEDYLVDYPYTAVYFPLQQDVRSFVVGEGMKFEVGVALGGVRQNTVDRNVQFHLDASLIDSARLVALKYSSWGYINSAAKLVDTLKLLPLSYYDMTPSTTIMVIPSGWNAGTVLITADSVNFLNDSLKTIMSTYALPFRIDDADADSILPAKSTNVVGTMFQNKLFGNYWHGGVAVINRPAMLDSTVVYKTTILLQNRKIFLNYSFTQVASPFWTYNCTDTLTFRNRIRDGVNEWQDENPSHYTK
jgi:hypothetical protein